MKKQEGMALFNGCLSDLEKVEKTLTNLYEQVTHPVSPEVRERADILLKHGINLAIMSLNFKDLPSEAKKPFAAFLYCAADALQEDGAGK